MRWRICTLLVACVAGAPLLGSLPHYAPLTTPPRSLPYNPPRLTHRPPSPRVCASAGSPSPPAAAPVEAAAPSRRPRRARWWQRPHLLRPLKRASSTHSKATARPSAPVAPPSTPTRSTAPAAWQPPRWMASPLRRRRLPRQ